MELLENLHWFCLQTKTNRALFLGQSPNWWIILTPTLSELEIFNNDLMKITQTKVDSRVPSGSGGVAYEIRH